LEEALKAFLRVELLFLALITFGPMLGAYWLYRSGHELPRVENAERRIVQPHVALPPLRAVSAGGRELENAWTGNAWSLVYARTSPCDETCLADLVRLLQVHLSLGGRDQELVQRIYLAPASDPRVMQDASILTARLDGAAGEALVARLRAAGEAPDAAGRIYVVDPQGRLVLTYPGNADQRGLRADLKRLLGARSG
jgi:hypothetical protein